jgi:hypothetical protein
MTPSDVQDPKKLVQSLLQRVHEQSAEAPERSPFWREGQWRCEFYNSGQPARLKVFSGEACVHEESVQSRAVADDRARELKRVFLQSQRGQGEHSLLK